MALAVAAYLNALANGFALDDIGIIVENPVVRNGAGLGSILTSPYWPAGASGVSADPTLYRPFTILTYVADAALWGLNATEFHAVNVALHAAATALVFILAARLFGGMPAPFASAALFAVHPLHTEAVTAVVGRADVLATVFFVGALLALRDRSRFSALRIGLGSGLWLLGLLSKEIAATLPLVLALDDRLHRHEFPAARASMVRILASRYGALTVAGVLYLVLRDQAVSGGAQWWPGFVGIGATPRVLTASRVLMEYLVLFAFPVRLLADYWTTEVPIATSLTDPPVALSIGLWVVTGALLVRYARRTPAVVLSAAWFFITILPVSNILFPIGVAKAERLTYLPSVGLCLAAGWGLSRVGQAARLAIAGRVAFAVLVAILVLRTARRNADWKDSLTLARATLALSPGSPLMNDIAAGELMKQGNAAAALPLLEVAARQAPEMPFIRTHLGTVYASLGRRDDAITEYLAALRLNPSDADAHNNLGVTLMAVGREEEAITHFRSAMAIRPALPDPHLNLGALLLGRNLLDSALARFSEAVRLSPGSAEAHNNLGVVLQRLGQGERAAAEYREALRLNPGHAKARENLAGLLSAR